MSNEWISVQDELPDEYGMYLCQFADGTIETFQFGGREINGLGWCPHPNSYVRFWMPLPDPAEEDV